MSEIVKICTKHGELKESEVKLRKGDKSPRCLYCLKEYEKNRPKREYKGAFADYHREHSRKWRQENSDKVNARIREDRKLNPEKYREYDRIAYYKDLKETRLENVLKKRKIGKVLYFEMIKKQDNRCLICDSEESDKSRSGEIKPLSVDHCHSCEHHIRGLLCNACNISIGKSLDSELILQEAILYLQKHQ